MIREEYNFNDIADYLYKSTDLLITGIPTCEDRSHFFSDLWKDKGKAILQLRRENNDKLAYQFLQGNNSVDAGLIDLCVQTSQLLQCFGVEQKNILLDLSSLDHVLIMFLTKQLIERVIPKSLFAAYIRPREYRQQSGNIGFSLCEQVLAVNSVPGFAKRESARQTLCAFLGFEGIRLKSILEYVHNIEKFIPVVAFPSGTPQWYNVTMWNSMDVLQSENQDFAIRKCFSESIFEAVNLLQNNIHPEDRVVLAPLGTRPHSMACAIFACQHQYSRIISDYAIENQQRTKGVTDITVYHLSSFLKV